MGTHRPEAVPKRVVRRRLQHLRTHAGAESGPDATSQGIASHRVRAFVLALATLLLFPLTAQPGQAVAATKAAEKESAGEAPDRIVQALRTFLTDLAPNRQSLDTLRKQWDLNLVPLILDAFRLMDPDDPRSNPLWTLLEQQTQQSFRREPLVWSKWLWQQQYAMFPGYPEFKAAVFEAVDPRFNWWFYAGMPHTIRLDEIVWGGVRVDGIPPLEHPPVIAADEASYLGGKNIVFGVFLNGEARAYPKRILAWHEMANDTVGDEDVTLVYCTLCGSAILYSQKAGARKFDFGTSGFLYRSNKLMYDRPTRSLWSALEGVPVTGSLVGSGLRLTRLPIVTTTWNAWRTTHPKTTVLSLETGYQRDYREGAAYREYFATQELMFPVPSEDRRLKNKQEVLALILEGEAMAFDTSFLEKRPLHHETTGGRSLVILTDASGANRVYDAAGVRFASWDRKSTLLDRNGQEWKVTEDAVIGPAGELHRRVPAHRAFWFGWYAQFPQSRLVR